MLLLLKICLIVFNSGVSVLGNFYESKNLGIEVVNNKILWWMKENKDILC